jgi:hypothetical protein
MADPRGPQPASAGRESPYLWGGAFYLSREDPRLWLPKRNPALGWTINFGHPAAARAMRVVPALALLALLGVGLWRLPLLLAAPLGVPWLLAAFAAAVAVSLLNACRWPRTPWWVDGLTFGTLAALIGFGLQTLLNAPVVAWLGTDALTWRAHVYLAAVAAGMQSFGKLMMIALLCRMVGATDTLDRLRTGLLVGLGFTLFEISVIWIGAVMRNVPIDSLLGVWERTSASLFHVYSAGLLALVIAGRRRLAAVVLGAHFITDWSIGANATLFHRSLFELELFFSAVGILVWIVFLLVARRAGAAPA